MEKRILLAFVLSFGVLMAFRWVFPPAETPAVPGQSSSTTTVPAATPPPSKPAVAAAIPGSVPAEGIHAEKAEELVVENDLYVATISNAGGVLKSFRMKKYSDSEGNPTELIDGASAAKVGWPLALTSGDSALDAQLAHANFVMKSSAFRVELEYAADGVYAHKALEFDPQTYQFKIDSTLSKNGQAVPHHVLWQAGFGDQSVPNDSTSRQRKNALYDAEAKFTRVLIGSVTAAQDVSASRIGIEDQYFMAMFMAAQPLPVRFGKADYNAADGTATTALYASMPAGQPITVYVGPKEQSALKAADPALEAVPNYGWIGIIAKPLTSVLLALHGIIGNFGWAIVILTCIINLCLFPLRLKSQVSMQKMQKLQPRMNALQDKYKKMKKTDPRRAEVQAEMMGLYSEHGINPLGGCLPLLLQMPFLYAFSSMLYVSIQLRGAPWILWVHDLSKHDPYYILPILMVVSMIVMQKLTPASMDPAQARMMMIMPIVFSAIFLWVQSGLQLYWLTSNVVGSGQQWFIRKYWSDSDDSKPKSRTGGKSTPQIES